MVPTKLGAYLYLFGARFFIYVMSLFFAEIVQYSVRTVLSGLSLRSVDSNIYENKYYYLFLAGPSLYDNIHEHFPMKKYKKL